jgi:hypothetical protein
MKPTTVCSLFLSALVASGCAPEIVRPGIWEIAYDLKYSRTGEPAQIDVRQVEVLVESASDDPEVMEVIEITPVAASNTIVPMYADVLKDRMRDSYKVRIMHNNDPDWIWSMHGRVRNAQFIDGTTCAARARYANTSLEGVWSMRWLRDP